MNVESILETLGRTPLVRISPKLNASAAHVWAKVESFNPGGSAKDRVAVEMVDVAEREGRLVPGGTIIEPTSGNTGVGLALVSAVRGYRMILVMPDTMSVERIRLAKAYGAEVILTPGKDGMKGSVAKAEELARTLPNAWIAGQFANAANPAAHERTTGPEIWEDLGGCVDAFVAGVGTGGTITGVGRYLKRQNAAVRIVAVEPASSPLLSKGVAGAHRLQGIGANFVPDALDRTVLDEVLPVGNDEAEEMTRQLAAREGILAGISSGAALFAALEVAKRPAFAGKNIVALLPDTGERYLSTGVFG